MGGFDSKVGKERIQVMDGINKWLPLFLVFRMSETGQTPADSRWGGRAKISKWRRVVFGLTHTDLLHERYAHRFLQSDRKESYMGEDRAVLSASHPIKKWIHDGTESSIVVRFC